MQQALRGVLAFALLASCGERDGAATDREPSPPAAIRLVTAFRPEAVEGSLPLPPPPPPTAVRFDGPRPAFEAGPGVAGLEVRAGRLAGRVASPEAALRIALPAPPEDGDFVHAVEVRMRASAGRNVRVELRAESAFEPVLGTPRELWSATSPLVPGEAFRTYTLRGTVPVASASVKQVFFAPTDAGEASFELVSVRVLLEKERLASIPAGPGWHGLGEIYRDTLVARAPETLRFPLALPAKSWLDLAVGTVEDEPVTFRATLRQGGREETLAERTVTTAQRWEPLRVDLARFAGAEATLGLSLASPKPGALGFWGAPVVRSPWAGDPKRPQGVILIQADTLRRDHLDVYGYERETAPILRSLAEGGVRFESCVAQATWTKVSSPSILLSLYPSSHGIFDFTDRLPDSADTLAERFRDAGYATLSLSSVFFTGKLTHLEQGYDELHESTSLPGPVDSSKTARIYVDRLLPWLEAHREVPFFVFLHVFDPHDPYRPLRPYDARFGDFAGKEEHERRTKEVRRFIEVPLLRAFGMPSRAELVKAGFDPDAYAAHERDWYDGSIAGMDVELGRLLEGLRSLALSERTLVVFTSDHGEEFLEHGRTFHGQSVYGELARVPLVFYGPGRVPPGRVVEQTVQSIDILPTVLELAGIAPPPVAQGRSLVPLFADGAGAAGSPPRPAVTEKGVEDDPTSPTAITGIATALEIGGWKLVERRAQPADPPTLELYETARDPLDQRDVAAANPEKVRELAAALEAWRAETARTKLEVVAPSDTATTPEELERLRSLGYVE